MAAIGIWIFMIGLLLVSMRYDLGIMDWLYDKGIYKDKLLTEVRAERRAREAAESGLAAERKR